MHLPPSSNVESRVVADTPENKDAATQPQQPIAAGGVDAAAALKVLASGYAQPAGPPMTAIELSRLRSELATGTYRPAEAVAPRTADSAQASSQADGPLPAAELAAIKAAMLVRPYVPAPMPGATPAKPGDDEPEV